MVFLWPHHVEGINCHRDDPKREYANHGTMLRKLQVCSKEDAMKSLVIKRSVVVDGHKTSISLEDEFWSGLKDCAGPGCVGGADGYRDQHDAPTEKSVVCDSLVCTRPYSRSENAGGV
jgi:hypothetical protein